MKTPYEEIIEKAFGVNQEIFTKNSQLLMFGKPIPEADQELITKMNKIIGICIDIFISEFHYTYEKQDDIVFITTENGTYSCPKNFIPFFTFVSEEDVYATKEDVFESTQPLPPADVIEAALRATILEEVFNNKPKDKDMVEVTPKPIPKPISVQEKELSKEQAPEPTIEPEIKPTIESTYAVEHTEETSEDLDFSQYFDSEEEPKIEEPLPIEEEPVTTSEPTIEAEMPIIEKESSDSEDIDFSAYFDAPDEPEEVVKEEPKAETPKEEPQEEINWDEYFSSLAQNNETEHFEPVSTETESPENKPNEVVAEPIEDTSDIWAPDEPVKNMEVSSAKASSDEFEPERTKYNFANTGLSHEGKVVSEYTVAKQNAIFTVFELYVIPGGVGNKERISIMVAPIENRTTPDANVPIIVSALYNGKRFTKSSIETIDLGRNLITFDVVNYHFLVRGSFDANLKFKASVNTTGKSIQEGTKIQLIEEKTYGTTSNEKYNSLHFTFNQEDDLTNCFIYPLKDTESSEFICILQTNEFIDYPYCSKTLVGTEKISIDNNGQRQELSCEWDNTNLKAKLTEVTYG